MSDNRKQVSSATQSIFDSYQVILFQGDSITDAARTRNQAEPNDRFALGHGYVSLIVANLLWRWPQRELTYLNRGVSGDEIGDLSARWRRDALDLNPDVISILVGINDVGQEVFGSGVTAESYAVAYRQLLTQTQMRLPNVSLILCEPFALLCGAVTEAWLPALRARQATVRELSAEFDAVFVPFQQALDAATQHAPAAYWLHDGVHPTLAGDYLLADTWLSTLLDNA